MKKVITIIIAILSIACFFLFNLCELRGEKIEKQKMVIKELQNEVARCTQNREKADKQICEIREVIRKVPTDCNCYDVPIDNSIIKRVRGK